MVQCLRFLHLHCRDTGSISGRELRSCRPWHDQMEKNKAEDTHLSFGNTAAQATLLWWYPHHQVLLRGMQAFSLCPLPAITPFLKQAEPGRVLASYHCCNRRLQVEWLKTSGTYSLTVLEVRNPKSVFLAHIKMLSGLFLLEASGNNPFSLALLASRSCLLAHNLITLIFASTFSSLSPHSHLLPPSYLFKIF